MNSLEKFVNDLGKQLKDAKEMGKLMIFFAILIAAIIVCYLGLQSPEKQGELLASFINFAVRLFTGA